MSVKKRWVKKRYYFSTLLAVVFLLSINASMSGFRKSEEEIRQYLLERGQQAPSFTTYEYQGRNIHYAEVSKEGDEAVIVFLHGSPGSLDAYLDYLADTILSRHATLIAVDRPGFGFSDFGQSLPDLHQQSLVMAPIIERFREQKIILVGHSYGGPLVARMGIDFAGEVDALVMVAPSISPELEPKIWWRKIFDWWGLRWLVPKSLKVCNQEIMPLKQDLMDMLPDWEKITARAVVVQGEKDKLVPKGNADFAEKMLVNSESVNIRMIEGGNHFVLWSEMGLIREEILGLVGQPPQIRTSQ
ncbi:MAG: alpha/beta fold hydrolase [Bacteroidota bacterium]